MNNLQQVFDSAVQAHRAGDLPRAERLYRQVLTEDPRHADALHHIGLLFRQQGHPEQAIASIRQALQSRPNLVEAHYNLGNALTQLGQLEEAAASYAEAVRLRPNYLEAHNNLGNVLKELGRLEEAAAGYRVAVRLGPDQAGAYQNLGSTLLELGRPDEAAPNLAAAVRLAPHSAEAHGNLANALRALGRLDEAVAHYRQAILLAPDNADLHNNLGAALLGQGKLEEGIVCYRQAVHLKPDFAAAHYNLGNVLKGQRNLDEAVACYRAALDAKSDLIDAHSNLGSALRGQGKLDESADCYRRILALKPDYADAHNNLGNALWDQGKLDEAAACFRRAVELKPGNGPFLAALVHALQHLCRWEELNTYARQVIEIVDRDADGGPDCTVPPFAFIVLPTNTTAAQQQRCARQWVDCHLKTRSRPEPNAVRPPAANLKSRITIGYLSADFHAHATTALLAELIEKHDRQRFAVFGYSYGPDDQSPMRRRLASAFDRFVDVKDSSFLATAERITADAVDILVDLKGYTQDTRTEIVALRPAPLQVNYLGYPATMGAPFIDYIVVDDFIVPSDQQPFFSEKLVHLPGCYQVNDSQRAIAAHTPTRAECGLPEDGFVFCSFNNSYKITSAMFDVWAELLHAVPGSVLWLLEGNRFAAANLCKEARGRGISAERLVFAPRRLGPDHLARHRLADLFLDTFPVNAHTTASDALWAGCPLVTLAGETFISRVAGSLLRALGLPELITTSLEEYQALALRLARDADLLAEWRARLDANRNSSALFDGEAFARKLEKAYVTMREIYLSGEKPRAFATNPT